MYNIHWYNSWTALQIGLRCNRLTNSIFLQNETFGSTPSHPFCKKWSEKWNEVVGAYVNHLHRQYRQPVSANMHITIIASPPTAPCSPDPSYYMKYTWARGVEVIKSKPPYRGLDIAIFSRWTLKPMYTIMWTTYATCSCQVFLKMKIKKENWNF